MHSGVRSTTESIARIGDPSPSSSSVSFSPGASLLHRQHSAQRRFVADGSPFLSGESAAGIGRDFGGESGAGSGGGLAQVRPRRVLYGPERALRAYAIEDARAAAMLRVRCLLVLLHFVSCASLWDLGAYAQSLCVLQISPDRDVCSLCCLLRLSVLEVESSTGLLRRWFVTVNVVRAIVRGLGGYKLCECGKSSAVNKRTNAAVSELQRFL